jgi:hypothetical protein
MQAGPSPAREARLQHRHAVRTLTYVTLDHGNGGILLNLTRSGVAVQSVAAVRMGQQVQIRFDLLSPRVRVNAQGDVVWSTSSGRCGIRFLDLSPQTARQLDEWTLAKLLEGASPLTLHPDSPPGSRVRGEESKPAAVKPSIAASANLRAERDDILDEQADTAEDPEPADSSDDHLIVSGAPVKVIDLPALSMPGANSLPQPASIVPEPQHDVLTDSAAQLDWLSQPLSGRSLVWTINGLTVAAAWLLFILVFLSVLREIPKWPGAMTSGAAIVIAGLYWGFFRMFAGASLGVKLARLAEGQPQKDQREENRFR